jgi:uncharacterized protein with FMN-binding domain
VSDRVSRVNKAGGAGRAGGTGRAGRPGGVGRAGKFNKKAPLVSAAACAGLAAVLLAHATGGTRSLLPASSRNTSGPGSGNGSGSGHSSGNSDTGAGTSGSSGSSGAGGSSSSSTVSGTATGAVEQYGYGELSVTVTVSHGKITALNVGRLATAESYSQQLAQQVIPMLRNEVLSAQSAQISGVSGATYTAEAYAASVQSALDKLHVK